MEADLCVIRSTAWFFIGGYDLDFDAITLLLDVEPAHVKKFSKEVLQAVPEFEGNSEWAYSKMNGEFSNPLDTLGDMICWCENKVHAFAEIRSRMGCNMELVIEVYYNSAEYSLLFTPAMLGRLERLGIPFVVEYVSQRDYGDDDADED